MRSKCYYYTTKDIKYKNTSCLKDRSLSETGTSYKFIAKGVKKSVNLTNIDFKKALYDNKLIRKNAVNIRSNSHIIKTIKENKLMFSSFDCKRFMLPCGRHSVPHGSAEKSFDWCDSFLNPCPRPSQKTFSSAL